MDKLWECKQRDWGDTLKFVSTKLNKAGVKELLISKKELETLTKVNVAIMRKLLREFPCQLQAVTSSFVNDLSYQSY